MPFAMNLNLDDDMKNDDASFECRVATGRKNWTSKVVRSVVCLKSDLQPNSCWFQFFSFSRAQGGLEVYYGHICPGNSTKNSIFVYSQSFSNECKITKLVDRCGVPKSRVFVSKNRSSHEWLRLRIESSPRLDFARLLFILKVFENPT